MYSVWDAFLYSMLALSMRLSQSGPEQKNSSFFFAAFSFHCVDQQCISCTRPDVDSRSHEPEDMQLCHPQTDTPFRTVG